MTSKLLFIVGLFLISSCTQQSGEQTGESTSETSNEINSEQVNINSELIEPFFTNDYCDSLIKAVDLLEIENHLIIEDEDSILLKLFHIEQWNDPGDFLKIQISNTSGQILFNENNFDGWVNSQSASEEILKQNKLVSEHIVLIETKTGKQLIVFGYWYASEPGILTIIDLFPEPQIIFNKKFYLMSLDQDENGYTNFVGSKNLTDTVTLLTQSMKFIE